MPLRLQPMVHVENMTAALAFYRSLGAQVLFGNDEDFTMLGIGGSELSLLAHPPNAEQDEGTVELNFEADEPLEDVRARLHSTTTIAKDVTDTGFGQQLLLRSPDGLLVKINRIDRGKI